MKKTEDIDQAELARLRDYLLENPGKIEVRTLKSIKYFIINRLHSGMATITISIGATLRTFS